MHYLTNVRMAMASELLRSQTVSVSQVAFRVGFVSETSFARTFKRHFGVAPGAFRRPEEETKEEPATKIERGAYPGFVFFG
jgi:transcriptional regulator GlxA family with amidase domain